jgi:hypothetical protein
VPKRNAGWCGGNLGARDFRPSFSRNKDVSKHLRPRRIERHKVRVMVMLGITVGIAALIILAPFVMHL